MNLKNWVTIIFMIVICSCGEKAVNKDGEVIHLNPYDATEYVNLSEIADSIICIKLQPAPDDVMGNVFDVIIKKKYIYALDISQNMLFVFDKTGKFVSKLSKKGEGHGEYRNIQIACIDDNEEYIEVIDGSTRRKLKYTNISFEFVESIPFDIRHNRRRMSNGFFYVAPQQMDNVIDNKKTNAGLLVVDDKNNLKILFDKYIENPDNFYFYPQKECFAQNDKNELFFSNMYDNTFYRLEAGEAYPVFSVDFGKYGIDNKHVGALSMKKQYEYLANMKGLVYMPVLTLYNSDIMSFSYYFKQEETEKGKWIISPEKDIRQYIKTKDKVYHTNKIRNDLTSFPDHLHICSDLYGLRLHEVWYEDYLVDVIATYNYFTNRDIEKIYVEGLGEITADDEDIIVILMKLKK
jgi:hypothetical protein